MVSLLLSLFSAPVSFGAHEASLSGDWPTFGNGPAHTSYFPGRLNSLKFALKWRAHMGTYAVSQAASSGERVFVSTGNYYGPNETVRALDTRNGQSLWTYVFNPASSINPPTYHGDSVYVQRTRSDTDSQIFSIDAVTGQTNWVTQFASQGADYFAPIVVDGTVFTETGYYSGLTAYDAASGVQKYFVRTLGSYSCHNWTPSYYDGKIYTWVNGYFAEHDPQNGRTNWSLVLGNQSEFLYSMDRSVAMANGRAYFTSTTNLFAVDLGQRQLAWSVRGRFTDTPAVANGIVYAISNGVVTAWTTNGAYVGAYRGTNFSSAFSGQMIVTDDVLIASGTYGVFVFNLADFSVQQYITSFSTNCYCYHLSSISLANNILYISSGSSNLLAYSAEGLWKLSINGNGGTHGAPSPHYYGTNYALTNAMLTETVLSPVAQGILTRHVVTGWTGAGSVPASGTSNTVTFVITNDSELTWNWQTEHWLIVEADYNGSVNLDDSWQLAGSTVTLTATPSNYYHFVRWENYYYIGQWESDASETSNVITLSTTAPRRVIARFEANRATNGVPEWWLARHGLDVSDQGALADSDGDGMANWQEYRAGTRPRDASSILRLATLPPSVWNPMQLTVGWPSDYGRLYTLWAATNLADGFFVLSSNISGYAPSNYFSRNIGGTDKAFYFIEAQVDP
jgi:hypothetical protein